MIALDPALDIQSNNSISLLDGGFGRPKTLLDALLDEDEVNTHLFEASNVSLSIHSVGKRTALREGWQGSFRSFNGSDLESSDLTNSSNSFFNVKEKSERPLPSRRTKILSLARNKELVVQPINSLLGLLKGSSTYEFTPELVSPKRLSNANNGCERRVRQLDHKSVISTIPLQNECIQKDFIDDTDIFEDEASTIRYYDSSSNHFKAFKTPIKSKLDSKRKQRDSPKLTSSEQSSDIHLQNKRDMSKETRPSTLICNGDIQEDSSFINRCIALKRHEKSVSPANNKSSIAKSINSLLPSLDDFLASNQGKDKVSMKNYRLIKKYEPTSVSLVSCKSIDCDDIMPETYEMTSSSNLFPSPTIDTANRKKLSIYNRDINHSSSTSNLSTSLKIHLFDDSAPKQPRRCQSPPRDDR